MDNDRKPRIIIQDCDFSDNGRHGISAEGEVEMEISNTTARGNKGSGFHTKEAPPLSPTRKWHEGPAGIVTLALISGGLLYFFGWS